MKKIVMAIAVALALLVAACGGDDKSSTSSGGGGGGSSAAPAGADVTKCGTEKGKKAAGTPIKLGAIATKQPGTDFTGIPNAAKACSRRRARSAARQAAMAAPPSGVGHTRLRPLCLAWYRAASASPNTVS
jgi:hypothetical protein